jgi:hypothetical protein
MSADDAIAEIESSFLEDFNRTIGRTVNVEGFPSILLIHPTGIYTHPARDTASIVKLIKSMKSKKTRRKKNRSKTR